MLYNWSYRENDTKQSRIYIRNSLGNSLSSILHPINIICICSNFYISYILFVMKNLSRIVKSASDQKFLKHFSYKRNARSIDNLRRRFILINVLSAIDSFLMSSNDRVAR